MAAKGLGTQATKEFLENLKECYKPKHQKLNFLALIKDYAYVSLFKLRGKTDQEGSANLSTIRPAHVDESR
jgi:hypothetical protein